MKFDEDCRNLRAWMKNSASSVLAFKKVVQSEQATFGPEADIAEMLANITLAYRHLEDASMRLGKAIQAYDGGQSVYDK